MQVEDVRIAINAGDGTLHALASHSNLRRIAAVFLTALDAEYAAGLIALVDYVAAIERFSLPRVYGPVGLLDFAARLKAVAPALARLTFTELEDGETVNVSKVMITCKRLNEEDNGQAVGYRISEPDWPGRFDVDAAAARGIFPGPDFGRLQRGEVVRGVRPDEVIAPARSGRRLAVAWKARPGPRLEQFADSARLLILAAPYIDERHIVAEETGYLTGAEAAILARATSVETLCLLQISRHTPPSYARKEAGQFHRRLFVPNDGDRFLVPGPDGGPVVHERSDTEAGTRRQRQPRPRRTWPR
jgi:ribonuclease Z